MSKCQNCIYYEVYEELNLHGEIQHHCKYTSGLFSQEELDTGYMGRNCRLWDAYIPNEATSDEVEYAQKWQKMGYYEQPDYYGYFVDLINKY